MLPSIGSPLNTDYAAGRTQMLQAVQPVGQGGEEIAAQTQHQPGALMSGFSPLVSISGDALSLMQDMGEMPEGDEALGQQETPEHERDDRESASRSGEAAESVASDAAVLEAPIITLEDLPDNVQAAFHAVTDEMAPEDKKEAERRVVAYFLGRDVQYDENGSPVGFFDSSQERYQAVHAQDGFSYSEMMNILMDKLSSQKAATTSKEQSSYALSQPENVGASS